jgi:hypothetical protein
MEPEKPRAPWWFVPAVLSAMGAAALAMTAIAGGFAGS